MKVHNIYRSVRPFISAMAVIATAAILTFTIYYTGLGSEWTTFLAGILVAAILAEATRASHAEWVVRRRTAQLTAAKDKLGHEIQLRKIAEKAVAAGKPRLHLIDEVLPTMVAFIDIEGSCRYHNRAFREGLRLRPDQIDGRHMRNVLGAKVYQETATAVRQSLDGNPVHYERTQNRPDGAVYKLYVKHIPQLGEDGKLTGFHMLMDDVTSHGDVRMSGQIENPRPTPIDKDADVHDFVHDGKASQDMFIDAFSEQVAGQNDDVSQIRVDIENGNFRLFCQLIAPVAFDSRETEHYEILVRLNEEEGSVLPPGTFFPLAEKYGLMPHLDRWVVQHVTEWASRQTPPDEKREGSMFFINVSGATVIDPGFPEFLQLTLLEHGVPAAALCFEIPDLELVLRTGAVAEFARQVRRRGCRIALSGFGRDKVSFDLIRGFQVEFLKIDGNTILDINRDPVKLAKVIAINRVAKKIGVKTIAELVENEETSAKLREVGIDFAQGFGISRPRPLAD